MDIDNECFKLDEVAPEDAFISFRFRGAQSLLKLFKTFVSDDILSSMLNDIAPQGNGIACGSRKRSIKGEAVEDDGFRHVKYMYPSIQKLKQKFAYEIRIIGLQNAPRENQVKQNGLVDAIKECSIHFKNLNPFSCSSLSLDDFKILNTTAIWTTERVVKLNEAFQSAVLRLGQCVAGDEKLFHFTGNGKNVRLVISKPGKVGHWFYELCAKCKYGNVFCLYIRLHNSATNQKISVNNWSAIIRRTGTDDIEAGRPNHRTYLVHDSYYFATEPKEELIKEKTNFMASCNRDRVKTEYSTLEHLWKQLPQNATKELSDLPVDKYAAMYNVNTFDCFVVHHDRQKGVGIKINYSHGMVRNTNRFDIMHMKNQIPCYYYYKGAFDSCDRFNRNLHDKSWPHARGGRGTAGDFLNQHDFAMACILQNVFSLFNELNATTDRTQNDYISWKYNGSDIPDPQRVATFCDKCLRLADEIFLDSLNVDPKEYLQDEQI